MRLLDLNIENYGVYTARHFDFSGPGFRLIYGPNEAGKTTLLQLIREALFGFPHVSPYVFENHTGKLAATVRMEMRNGRRVRFRRQKGSKNTVTGEVETTRQPVDDESLNDLLGRAGGPLFEHVFGFSLTELSAGEKSLQHANLTEALYGSGVGGLAGFQQLQQSLQDEHQKLFSPRGRKPLVNRLLASIADRSRMLRESSVRPREYNELQESVDACSAQVDALSKQLDQLRLEERRLERLELALDAWTRCQVLREEIAQRTDSGSLPSDASDRFRQARALRDETRQELNRLETSLALLPDVAEVSERTSPNADGVANNAGQSDEPVINEQLARALNQDVNRIRDCIRQLPKLREKSDAARQTLLVRLQQLNPDWSIEELTRLQATQPQRELVREHESEWNELQQLETSLSSQRPELQRQLNVTRRRLETLSTDSREILPGLEDLIERSTKWSANRDRLAELQAEETRLNGELDSILHRLRSALSSRDSAASVDNLKTLVLPLLSQVEAARAQQEVLTQDTRRAGDQVRERRQELADAEQQLRERDAVEAVTTIESLTAARQERDVSWSMIRRRYVDGVRDDAPVPDPEEFERSVAAADYLADERLANAEAVARREHLLATVEKARERVDAAQTQLQQHCAVCETAESQWRNQWPIEITPGSPDAMLEWLRLHGELVRSSQRRDELAGDISRLSVEIEAYEAELIRALQTPLQSPEASLAHARDMCEASRREQMERSRLTAELPDLDSRLRSLDGELHRVDKLKSQWRSRWADTVTSLGIPADWSVQTAGRLLNELAELQLKQREAESLAVQASGMQTEVQDFEVRVAELTKDAGQEVQSLAPVDAVVEFVQRIDAARQAAIDQQELVSRRRELVRQISVQNGREQQAAKQVDNLLAQCGTSSVDEFLQRVETAQKGRQLDEQLELRERDIRVIRGSEDEAAFISELQGLTPESVGTRRQGLQQRIAQLESECQQTLQKAGAVRQELDGLNSGVDSIQIAAELESLRAELGNAVDNWAALVMTRTLMTRALEQFEREHQPRMLTEVAQLLSLMTDGRYTGIERKLDRTGTLLVRDSFGRMLEPSALSTGTREQLYLAIRLAFALQYCEDSEPLPLIMDDILVNFDHTRTRNTLRVLGAVSEHVQILFLTCHRHMVDLTREIIADSEPLILNDQGRLDLQTTRSPMPVVKPERFDPSEPVVAAPQPKLTRNPPEPADPATPRQTELF